MFQDLDPPLLTTVVVILLAPSDVWFVCVTDPWADRDTPGPRGQKCIRQVSASEYLRLKMLTLF